MFVPTSSLSGGAWFASQIFPSTYFQAVSVGAFTKDLGFTALWPNLLALAIIAAVYFTISAALIGTTSNGDASPSYAAFTCSAERSSLAPTMVREAS